MTVKTPSTPASKIDRTPSTTPGGGHRAKEEKIVVTVRLRPLSKREQLAKDNVSWQCTDDHTIVYKPASQERLSQSASFTFGKFMVVIVPFLPLKSTYYDIRFIWKLRCQHGNCFRQSFWS